MKENNLATGARGIDNEYGVLRDLLLGKPDFYRWVEAGPLIRRTLENQHKTGVEFDFVDVGFHVAKDLGVNLVSLGDKRDMSMAGSVGLNAELRARGYQVFAPDMSMFTLGGGMHCLCQALRRDPGGP